MDSASATKALRATRTIRTKFSRIVVCSHAEGLFPRVVKVQKKSLLLAERAFGALRTDVLMSVPAKAVISRSAFAASSLPRRLAGANGPAIGDR
jgi:hypothetical protein